MKIGLALGGGGARGSYQIGCFKALEEVGLLKEVTHVSGTSIGALNALLLMSKKTHEEQIAIWKELSNTVVYQHKRTDKKGIYSADAVYHKLKDYIKASEISSSDIDGYAVTAFLNHSDSYIGQITKKKMKLKIFHLNQEIDPFQSVIASASIPLIFGPKQIDESKYVDGGILNNHPVEPLVSEGCKFIINIPLDRFFKPSKFSNQNLTILDLGAKKDYYSLLILDVADATQFKKKRINKRYLYGYYVTKHMLELAREKGILNEHYHPIIQESFTHLKIDSKNDLAILSESKEQVKNGYDYI